MDGGQRGQGANVGRLVKGGQVGMGLVKNGGDGSDKNQDG